MGEVDQDLVVAGLVVGVDRVTEGRAPELGQGVGLQGVGAVDGDVADGGLHGADPRKES